MTDSNRDLGLINKYGPLLTLNQCAEVFHRSHSSLRVTLSRDAHTPFSRSLRKARLYIGKRVYFKAADIEQIINDLK